MDIRAVLIVLLSVMAIVAFTGCDNLVITEDTTPDYCDKQTGEDFFGQPLKEICYERLARTKLDYALCEGTNAKFKQNCISNVASSNLDLAGCEKLSAPASVESCKKSIISSRTPEGILAIDDKMVDMETRLKNNPDDQVASDRLMKLQAIRDSLLLTLTPAEKAVYAEIAEPTNRKIAGEFAKGEIDLATKDSMFRANKVLRENRITLDDKGYEALKNYHVFLNDPDNNIMNMDDAGIVKDRFGDKVGNVASKFKFWETTTAEEKGYDQQLRFYQRMVERQAAIQSEQKDLENALASATGLTPSDNVDPNAVHANDWLKLTAEQKVAGYVFGQAAEYPLAGLGASLPLGVAISAAQSAARDAEFRGLVKLYDTGMAEELGKAGGDRAKAHAQVVKNLESDATYYGASSGLVGQNNLLVNKDCDGTNPHCINHGVFWQSMQKSYNYQHPT